jgi:hypothetical protein
MSTTTANPEIVRSFLYSEGSTIVSVQFMKKDGTMRRISFNPRDRNEVKGTGNPTSDPYIFRIRDLNIAREEGFGAWRSFDLRRVVSIRSRRMVYNFQQN